LERVLIALILISLIKLFYFSMLEYNCLPKKNQGSAANQAGGEHSTQLEAMKSQFCAGCASVADKVHGAVCGNVKDGEPCTFDTIVRHVQGIGCMPSGNSSSGSGNELPSAKSPTTQGSTVQQDNSSSYKAGECPSPLHPAKLCSEMVRGMIQIGGCWKEE
jgi:hypothetical protein